MEITYYTVAHRVLGVQDYLFLVDPVEVEPVVLHIPQERFDLKDVEVASAVGPHVILLGGLLLFGAVFAINSSMHSYLIVSYGDTIKPVIYLISMVRSMVHC